MRPNLEARSRRLTTLLAHDGFDGLVVSDLANIRYLTGFNGTWSRLVVGPEANVLVLDRRYLDQTADLPAGLEVVCVEGVRHADAVREAVRMCGASRLGFEPGTLSWYEQGAIAARLPDRVAFRPAGGQVEELRAIKDEVELALITEAARATDQAIVEALGAARPGATEIEVAAALAAGLRRHGDGGAPAFEPLVASGPATAHIHGHPGSRTLAAGDLLLIDAGATRGGMCADCSRTVVVGQAPDRRQREALRIVRESLDAAIGAIKPGVAARDVAVVARKALERRGYHLDHDLGHGVGLEIHEEPRLSTDSEAILEVGMVVAVEPGLYVPGWGGVRIEELVMVTAKGARVLTAAPSAIA